MNIRLVCKYLSNLVLIEAVFILPSALVSCLYEEMDVVLALLASVGLCLAAAGGLRLAGRGAAGSIYAREGFVVAGLGWILVSLLGAFPFYFSGEIPHFVDALFESISGFSTTGASVIGNVDAMSRGLVFWRSFSHWLGGIGVLTFMLLVVRSKGAGFTLHFLRAETPGPGYGKVAPKTRSSVRFVFAIYIGLSLLNLLLLSLGDMPLFDSVCTVLGTAGTGGFNFHNNAGSMAVYSHYTQVVVTVFMLLFGTNFLLMFLLLRGEWKTVIRDSELRLYYGIFAAATLLIAGALVFTRAEGVAAALRESAFTVSSLLTTTGYSVTDTSLWPAFARTLLLILMLFGSMSGSTGGGFKMIRILVLFKTIRNGLYHLQHPRSIRVIRVNGKKLDEDIINRTLLFLCSYCGICLVSFVLVSFDGLTLESNFSTVLSCISNIGPGPATVGQALDYNAYSPFSKIVLSLCMLLGRLEIFPVLILFSPETWRRKT